MKSVPVSGHETTMRELTLVVKWTNMTYDSDTAQFYRTLSGTRTNLLSGITTFCLHRPQTGSRHVHERTRFLSAHPSRLGSPSI